MNEPAVSPGTFLIDEAKGLQTSPRRTSARERIRCILPCKSEKSLVLCATLIPMDAPQGAPATFNVIFFDAQTHPCPMNCLEEPMPDTQERSIGNCQLKAALDAMADPAYIATADYRIVFRNAAFRAFFDGEPDAPCHQLLHRSPSPCDFCAMEEILKGQDRLPGAVFRTIRKILRSHPHPSSSARKPGGKTRRLSGHHPAQALNLNFSWRSPSPFFLRIFNPLSHRDSSFKQQFPGTPQTR